MEQRVKLGKLYSGSTGDILLQDKTVEPSLETQTITADSGYQGLSSVIISAIPANELNTPTLTINSNGLIQSSIFQPSGYVSESMKSKSLQLITRGSEQITPTTIDIEIDRDTYLTGKIVIKGDANLKAENIREGVNLFGINGTHVGGADENRLNSFIKNELIHVSERDLEGVTYLRDRIFGYSNIQTINIPTSVTKIGGGAFSSSKLTEIDLPSSITKFDGQDIFYGCRELLKVKWPGNIDLPTQAFYSCEKLEEFDLSRTTKLVPFKSNAFSYVPKNVTVIVPGELYDSYRNSDWSAIALKFKAVGKFIEVIPDVVIFNDEGTSKKISTIIAGEWNGFNVNVTSDNSNLVISNVAYTQSTGDSEGNISFNITNIATTSEYNANVTISITEDTGYITTREINCIVINSRPEFSYTVDNVEGSTYRFELNDSGYYQNTNQLKNGTYSICQVNILSDGVSKIYIDYLQSSEYNYDFGIISLLDESLNLNNTEDTSSVKVSLKGENNQSTVKTIDYGVIPFGEHFFQIKYRKDGSGENGTDTFQFKIRVE